MSLINSHRVGLLALLLGAAMPIGHLAAQPTGALTPPATAPAVRLQSVLPRAVPTEPSASPAERFALRSYVLKSDKTTTSVDVTRGDLYLHQGELLVSRVATQTRAIPRAAATHFGAVPSELPYEASFVEPGGTVRTGKVVAEVSGGGLRVTGSAPEFVADVYVMLRDRDDATASYELPSPVELLIQAPIDEVKPAVVRLSRANAWETVALRSRAPSGPVSVRIKTPFEPTGIELNVPLTRPVLEISPGPAKVAGFGLATSQVVVHLQGLANPIRHEVMLTSSRGRLESPTVALNAEGFGKTTLRSGGVGPVVLTAKTPLVDLVTNRELTFDWPISFLLCAMLGGATGAWIASARRAASGRGGWGRAVANGVPIGILVAAAAAVGINLTTFELPSFGGEALVFVLGAIGGLSWWLKGPGTVPAPATT